MTYHLIHEKDPDTHFNYVFHITKDNDQTLYYPLRATWNSSIEAALNSFLDADFTDLRVSSLLWYPHIVASFSEIPTLDQIQSTHPELFI